jgi:octaheme c-type cytochrome (tetrathionate reductase family)
MRTAKISEFRFLSLVFGVLFALAIAGCDGDDGLDGQDGLDGADGAAGADGLACWDLNGNGVEDPDEDLNGDGVVDVLDCNALANDISSSELLHKDYFTDNEYKGTQSCLNCHGLEGMDMLTKAHFTWQGVATNIVGDGIQGQIHGKNDIINNFCVAVPSNEGRCTQCHAGYGYDDNNYDFGDMKNIDCLVCHDQTGDYEKDLTTAGLPKEGIDLNAVARSVATPRAPNETAVPTIDNCIDCHAFAGGGDNVKHGDLASTLANTTREFDVHMGTDGADYECVECHQVKKDGEDALIDHGIGGMPYHSVDEGVMVGCVDCHGDAPSVHAGTSVQTIVNSHPTLACQVCHIPTFARGEKPTKVSWKWSDAGLDGPPEGVVTPDPVTGLDTWAKKKGTFVWANDVRPTLLYHDGTWNKMIINKNDQYTELPAYLGGPAANYTTEGAMIYPFKKMVGNQPADANNNTILVPHLFGGKGGPNPFWKVFDWDLALQDGATYAGQTYTGEFEFVDTVMYLAVNHEIADGDMSLGKGLCNDCHGEDQIDWNALGWTADPAFDDGQRIPIP